MRLHCQCHIVVMALTSTPLRPVALQQPQRPLRWYAPPWADEAGSVVIEAAFAIPLMIVLLAGLFSYGMWFATATTLQQVANEAARSVLGSLNAGERQMLIDQSIDSSLLHSGLIDPDDVTVSTAVAGRYFTVTLVYDGSKSVLFSQSLVPMPSSDVTRQATIELSNI